MGAIKLECGSCGSDRAEIAGRSVEDAWIVCAACGDELISYAALHDEIVRQARLYATQSITQCFGSLPECALYSAEMTGPALA